MDDFNKTTKNKNKFLTANFEHYIDSFGRFPEEFVMNGWNYEWEDFFEGKRSSNISDFSIVYLSDRYTH